MTTSPRPTQVMLHSTVWALQIFLSMMFVLVGVTRLGPDAASAAQTLPWVAVLPDHLLGPVAVLEIAIGVGLTAPSATRIVPVVTPAIAVLAVVALTLAAVAQVALHGAWAPALALAYLGVLAAGVAWGRGVSAPIPGLEVPPRSRWFGPGGVAHG